MVGQSLGDGHVIMMMAVYWYSIECQPNKVHYEIDPELRNRYIVFTCSMSNRTIFPTSLFGSSSLYLKAMQRVYCLRPAPNCQKVMTNIYINDHCYEFIEIFCQ